MEHVGIVSSGPPSISLFTDLDESTRGAQFSDETITQVKRVLCPQYIPDMLYLHPQQPNESSRLVVMDPASSQQPQAYVVEVFTNGVECSCSWRAQSDPPKVCEVCILLSLNDP